MYRAFGAEFGEARLSRAYDEVLKALRFAIQPSHEGEVHAQVRQLILERADRIFDHRALANYALEKLPPPVEAKYAA